VFVPRLAFWLVVGVDVAAGLVIGRIFGPGWGVAVLIVGVLALLALRIEGDPRFFFHKPDTNGD
jgi:hypothetical protein